MMLPALFLGVVDLNQPPSKHSLGVAMSWYVRTFEPVLFDPGVLAVVQSAFDGAWELHEPSYAPDDPQRDLARDTLAKAIIECARGGELDKGKLINCGYRAMMRYRNPAG